MNTKAALSDLRSIALAQIAAAQTPEQLYEVKRLWIGRKGILTTILRGMFN